MIKLAIAVGRGANAKSSWKNRVFTWSDFLKKIENTHYTHESVNEYLTFQKPEQDKIKDVGGYVAGYLNNGRRRIEDVMIRSALTLDLDFAPYDIFDDITLLWGCALAIHSTHKHRPDNPRYRLIVPLDREVTPDEYVAIARKFAASINIEYFDPTTFDVNRLMFWPSTSKDGEYIFEYQDGPALSADKILGLYRNWRDISEWSFAESVINKVNKERGKRQENPLLKNNIVGYFCEAYDIHEAIAEFLPDKYEIADNDDRYTYLLGSCSAGLVTYDDIFAYSHHGTDPATGQLCNAFDLVRIHKFSELDAEDSISRSYKAMSEFARNLAPVKRVAAKSIVKDFDEFVEPLKNEPETEQPERSEKVGKGRVQTHLKRRLTRTIGAKN